mgnify:CR=1 FL=1
MQRKGVLFLGLRTSMYNSFKINLEFDLRFLFLNKTLYLFLQRLLKNAAERCFVVLYNFFTHCLLRLPNR